MTAPFVIARQRFTLFRAIAGAAVAAGLLASCADSPDELAHVQVWQCGELFTANAELARNRDCPRVAR